VVSDVGRRKDRVLGELFRPEPTGRTRVYEVYRSVGVYVRVRTHSARVMALVASVALPSCSRTEVPPAATDCTQLGSLSAGSTSTAGDETTSTGQSESTTSSGTSTSVGSSSTGSPDPETVCRTRPDPRGCPPGGAIGLPEPQGCVPVDVYFYDAPGACTDEFETRCEVMATSSTGSWVDCSDRSYKDGWFRELDGGSVEFWGVWSNNPPLEPGLTRCRDEPEMCACECEALQPE